VTSDTRAHPPEQAAAPAGSDSEGRGADETTTGTADADTRAGRARLSLPLVPVLGILLVLLLGGVGYLWFTRPEPSAVHTEEYAEVLQAARSAVVDVTSFDYLTIDDDVEQIRRVTTGDLREEAVARLEDQRQALAEGEVIVNTEVVAAGVTRADDDGATVVLAIQSTQENAASEQTQISKYRIEVELTRQGGRWLLSGITGTGS
jgi:hypothetical protein